MARVCKEQCTQCKCTVQEREIECPAEDLCEDGGREESVKPSLKPEAKDDCSELYRDLGECLQKCLCKTDDGGADEKKSSKNKSTAKGDKRR